jgi:hypothetical protein
VKAVESALELAAQNSGAGNIMSYFGGQMLVFTMSIKVMLEVLNAKAAMQLKTNLIGIVKNVILMFVYPVAKTKNKSHLLLRQNVFKTIS